MMYAMGALYKNDKFYFHNRLKVLETTATVLAKATSNDLLPLKTS